MPRRTSLGRRCYNPFSKENYKRDPCSLRTISATLRKTYLSILIDAKLCVNCRKEISQFALPCSLYSHTDPTIEDASVINDNSSPILGKDNLMEDEDIFANPSTSKFEKSETDYTIMCSVPTSECYLNECTACHGTSALKDFITSVLED